MTNQAASTYTVKTWRQAPRFPNDPQAERPLAVFQTWQEASDYAATRADEFNGAIWVSRNA
jgi:hypothetical protein